MKVFLIVLGALIYTLSPIDLIPDFVALLGWLDDALLWTLVYWYLAPRKQRAAEFFSQSMGTGPEHSAADGPSADAGPQTPHDILGVAPGASQEEIRAAYRREAARYHPDKVAHLGEEFREMAERRFREIQAAYEALRDKA